MCPAATGRRPRLSRWPLSGSSVLSPLTQCSCVCGGDGGGGGGGGV